MGLQRIMLSIIDLLKNAQGSMLEKEIQEKLGLTFDILEAGISSLVDVRLISESKNQIILDINECEVQYRALEQRSIEEETEERIFDEATKSKGGLIKIFTPSHLGVIEVFKSILAESSKRTDLKKPFPKIIYNFIDNYTFGAHCQRYEDSYIIAINNGTKIILYDLFNRIMATKSIMSAIGNPNDEEDLSTLTGYYSSVQTLMEEVRAEKYKYVRPKNETRKWFAVLLTQIALRNIFEHELAHILYGHLDYVRSVSNLSIISETEDMPTTHLDSKTLEMNADLNAFLACYGYGMFLVQHFYSTDNRKPPIHEVFHQFVVNPNGVCHILFFAVYNTFRISTEIKSRVHPPARIRVLMLARAFKAIIRANDKYFPVNANSEDIIERIMEDVLREGERAFEIITGNKIDLRHFERLDEDPLPKKLRDYWTNKLKNEVEKFEYIPNPYF